MKESPILRFPFSVRRSVWLSKYSTLRIGGPANYFKTVHSVEEACQVIHYLKHMDYPFIILGKGSNCLFDDRGFDGFVLYNAITGKEFLPEMCLKAYSGLSFASLAKISAYNGFSGLEFAIGIPGSVGGAVYMNAGTGENDVASVIKSVEVINDQGKILTYTKEELELSYRSSRFHHRPEFILSATFQLTKNPLAPHKVKTALQHRIATQPCSLPSAGCVFRNPPTGGSAGKLIDEAGLKNFSIGGAKVSPTHANFIVNTGRATSEEVKKLIGVIRSTLKTRGIELEEELCVIPYRLPNNLESESPAI
ncbi:UDP-N-acetylmuramate dehydrogenase [Chlamydia pecorum]|uniref:UDP-N-acetylmuramate dehydrogenase n=1 Tax=Chlamydia pecorum TaxID=85991 RepID=UPI0003D3F2AF|nr:UDP-N-acetylmuramate dehydrogenase [Chlamydia pecorum]ETF38435.1 UDP-N-acetylenolpyruvoylglucosamine reductase [Chlamydia pecorum VR629]